MASVTKKVAPAPIHGVSTQPYELMTLGQCEVQDNCWTSLTDILTKRYPSEHFLQAFKDHGGPGHFFTYDRSETEKYAFTLYNQEVRAFDLIHRAYLPIYKKAGGPSDFSYLDCIRTDNVGFTTADGLSGLAAAGGAGKAGTGTFGLSTEASFGLPWGGIGVNKVFRVASNTTGGFSFGWTFLQTGYSNLRSGKNSVSLFWKFGAGTNVGIGIWDADGSVDAMVARVKWTAASDSLTNQTIAVGTSANVQATATKDGGGGGWWWLTLTYTPPPTSVGHQWQVGVYLDTGDVSNNHYYYGMRIDQQEAPKTYIQPPREVLTEVPVYDYIYLLNRNKVSAKGTAVPYVPQQISITFDHTKAVPADNATVIVTTGGTAYNFIFKVGGGTDVPGTYYIDTGAAKANTLSECAEMLAQKIGIATGLIAVSSLQDGSTGAGPTKDPVVNVFSYISTTTITETGDSGSTFSISSSSPFYELILFVRDAGFSANIGVKIKQGTNFIKAASATSNATNATGGSPKAIFYKPAGALPLTQPNVEETAGSQDYAKGVFYANGDALFVTDVTTDGMALDLAYREPAALPAELKTRGIRSQFINSPFPATNSVYCDNSTIRVTSLSPFDEVIVTDSFGGTGLVKIQGEVRDPADFPPSAPQGWVVKVQNKKDTTEDDYWVKANTENGKGFSVVKEWVETTAPGVLLDYSKTTLPHILTRRQDDIAGTITGTPFQIYFEYDFGQWQSRAVGDDDSNPYPSFIAQASRAISETRSRLELAGGNKTSWSEVNNLWNFFQSRISVNLDSDPIDNNNQAPTSANYIRPTVINHLQPFKNRLLVFADSVIFALFGEPILTSKTIQSKAVSEHDSLPNCHPVSSGQSVFFARGQSGFSSIWELFASEEAASEEILDQSRGTRGYITGEAFQLAASPTEQVLALATDLGSNKFWEFKWDGEGNQRLQAAWQTNSFATNATVTGLSFMRSDLWELITRPYGVYIEKMRHGQKLRDPNNMPICRLDRRMSNGDPGITTTYSAGPNQTTYDWSANLPAPTGVTAQPVNTVDSSTETFKVVKQADLSEIAVVSRTNTTLVVSGNQVGVPVWLGLPYLSRYRPHRAAMLEFVSRSQAASPVAIVASEVRLGRLIVGFKEAYDLYLQITRKGVVALETPSLVDLIANGKASLKDQTSPDLWNGTWSIPVGGPANETIVELQSTGFLPWTITTVEVEMDYNPPQQRV